MKKSLKKLENLSNVEKLEVTKSVKGGTESTDVDSYSLTIVVYLERTEVEDIIIIY